MVLALVVMNVTLWAQSGYCGDPNVNGGMDVKWAFADGVLTISGVGAMAAVARVVIRCKGPASQAPSLLLLSGEGG